MERSSSVGLAYPMNAILISQTVTNIAYASIMPPKITSDRREHRSMPWRTGASVSQGRTGGYGWLIIIDHPQVNLYSLYGHLSPSRWKLESGTEVKRGDLIAYLGDSDENGGSADEPLEPHLHFGVRAGQTADYPAKGEWRFMAGWIRLCPQDLGWLQPSVVITRQETPCWRIPGTGSGIPGSLGRRAAHYRHLHHLRGGHPHLSNQEEKPLLAALSGSSPDRSRDRLPQ